MTKKYKFSIATNYINSEWSEEVEIEFDGDESEEEIEDIVEKEYTQWLFDNNHGTIELIS